MPRVRSHPRRVRIRKRRHESETIEVRRSWWDVRLSSWRQTALAGFLIGASLGCLFGATWGMLPSGNPTHETEMLSVNQKTGKPQLHIKGKPEIK